MANNFNYNNSGSYYDNQHQDYQADEHMGPYYENTPNNNLRGHRNPPNQRGGRGQCNESESRSMRSVGQNQRNFGSRRGAFNNDRGRNPRNDRGGRGNFDPLPSQVNWSQQLEKNRKIASLNWAPSFRAANIQIPAQFYTHTKEEQAVLGQELMDLGVAAAASSQPGAQQDPSTSNAQPLDIAALDMEADDIAGELMDFKRTGLKKDDYY